MKDLKIAEGFALPIDLVTSTQAILARKRSGKSYTASVEAEEMLEHGQQIAVIDPTSAWYGLRSSADGKGPGYAVVVFGGEHADAPLEPRGGKAMARALVEHGFSAIFDVGNWITEDQIQFVLDFSSELLRINRDALHLFIDEADTFAPQLLEGKDQKKCLGAVSRLVKQGGIKGIGVMNEVAGHIRVIAAIVLAYEDEDSAPPPLPRVAVHPPAAARIPEVRALAHAAVQYVQNVPNGTDGTSAQPIKAGARRMLGVLCQWHPKALSEAQVAVQSEMKRSGTFDSYKSALRTAGLIEIQDGKWKATRAGLDFLGARFGPPPRTTAEVFAVWAPKLKLGARRMLEVLIRSPHVLIPRAELAKSVGMAESGTFDSYLSALRTADLIITEKGHVAANREVLFL
jgi:hypothetical protein